MKARVTLHEESASAVSVFTWKIPRVATVLVEAHRIEASRQTAIDELSGIFAGANLHVENGHAEDRCRFKPRIAERCAGPMRISITLHVENPARCDRAGRSASH